MNAICHYRYIVFSNKDVSAMPNPKMECQISYAFLMD